MVIDHKFTLLCQKIRQALTFRNRKKIFSNVHSSKFFTIMTPAEWKRNKLPLFKRMGGVQTGYRANAETYKISKLNNDAATHFLSPTNTPLINVAGTRTYSATDVTVHYSTRTLRVKVGFTMTYTGGLRRGFRHGPSLLNTVLSFVVSFVLLIQFFNFYNLVFNFPFRQFASN